MKWIGIALLFGLCTLAGFRIAAKKGERLKTVRELLLDVQAFSDALAAGNGSISKLAAGSGPFCSILAAYLRALDEGRPESDAAALACEGLRADGEERAALLLFMTGLSAASKDALRERIAALTPALRNAEAAAETEAKQGRAFRCIGVLIGAGLAILLL